MNKKYSILFYFILHFFIGCVSVNTMSLSYPVEALEEKMTEIDEVINLNYPVGLARSPSTYDYQIEEKNGHTELTIISSEYFSNAYDIVKFSLVNELYRDIYGEPLNLPPAYKVKDEDIAKLLTSINSGIGISYAYGNNIMFDDSFDINRHHNRSVRWIVGIMDFAGIASAVGGIYYDSHYLKEDEQYGPGLAMFLGGITLTACTKLLTWSYIAPPIFSRNDLSPISIQNRLLETDYNWNFDYAIPEALRDVFLGDIDVSGKKKDTTIKESNMLIPVDIQFGFAYSIFMNKHFGDLIAIDESDFVDYLNNAILPVFPYSVYMIPDPGPGIGINIGLGSNKKKKLSTSIGLMGSFIKGEIDPVISHHLIRNYLDDPESNSDFFLIYLQTYYDLLYNINFLDGYVLSPFVGVNYEFMFVGNAKESSSSSTDHNFLILSSKDYTGFAIGLEFTYPFAFSDKFSGYFHLRQNIFSVIDNETIFSELHFFDANGSQYEALQPYTMTLTTGLVYHFR